MNYLPNSCKGLELPYKIEAWCKIGRLESEHKINDYLKTFFNKQEFDNLFVKKTNNVIINKQ